MMGQLHEAFTTSAREVGLLDQRLQLIEGEKASIWRQSTTRAACVMMLVVVVVGAQ